MTKLGADSDGARRIDAALEVWRQGDLALDEKWFVHAAEPALALTDAAAALGQAAEEESGPIAITTEVEGLVVVTQTCDIIRSCLQKSFVEICPLVVVDESSLKQIERARLPSYAYVSAAAGQRLVAHLDHVMTVEKSVVASWSRTPGWTTDRQARAFAFALARKRVRFAFPDDFTALVKKLQSRLAEKHDKDTPEGKALRALREVRVAATPSWEADEVQIQFWFVRYDESLEFGGRNWADWLESWRQLVPPNGRFKAVEGQVATLAEMTAADYVESDSLDLDHVTQRSDQQVSAPQGQDP